MKKIATSKKKSIRSTMEGRMMPRSMTSKTKVEKENTLMGVMMVAFAMPLYLIMRFLWSQTMCYHRIGSLIPVSLFMLLHMGVICLI